MKRPIRRLFGLALVALVAGCAHLGLTRGDPRDLSSLWIAAHEALARAQFSEAEAGFERLAMQHGGSLEGRESLFYLGAIRLDPRNPEWDSGMAQIRLGAYLSHLNGDPAPRLYRYPEASTLHEIARQLNLPPAARMGPLQPEQQVITIEERVVVPAEQSRELEAEVNRLRQELAERDTRIRQQQEELDRIRRTLTAPPR